MRDSDRFDEFVQDHGIEWYYESGHIDASMRKWRTIPLSESEIAELFDELDYEFDDFEFHPF